ncbi:MAG: IclR family transcriptional regulator [Burkholderiaceae bacterium]|nr:IclR family transcriptional regulator [Burkholderiaceae bacterium]
MSTETASAAGLRHTPPAEPARLVPAVERAVRILDALAAAPEPIGLADLARQLALPKSSLHGLMQTLVAMRMAVRYADARFALGPRPIAWAGHYADTSKIVAAFESLAARADALRSETVMLAVLDDTDVVYLACRPGTRALAVNFRAGGRFPASCTSTGKAILATMSNERIRARYAGHRLQRLTRKSAPSMAAFLRMIEATRHAGYAADDEETAEGMHCFGAPVKIAGQQDAQAAVAVSLIKAQTSARRRQEIIREIQALAAEISARLGASSER